MDINVWDMAQEHFDNYREGKALDCIDSNKSEIINSTNGLTKVNFDDFKKAFDAIKETARHQYLKSFAK